MLQGGINMSTSDKKSPIRKKGFDDPIIADKKKPGEEFEVPVFKDKPEIKPVVKKPSPPPIKPDLDKS